MEIMLHDEVQLLGWGETRARGPYITLRLKDPAQLEVFRGMDTATEKRAGHIMNLTLSQGDILADEAAKEKPHTPTPFGKEARVLRQWGFFRERIVQCKVGTDAQYLDWVRLQECAVCKNGAPPSEAAHVRSVAKGAGASIKPPYSAIPLCHEHHELQHQKGIVELYNAAHPKAAPVHGKTDVARRWLNEIAAEYVEDWAWDTLKFSLGYMSWSEVPPYKLREWAMLHDVWQLLPKVYAEAA